MNKIEKAEANLAEKEISTEMENDTLYVYIDEYMLELSEFEINFQAEEYNRKNHIND